MDLAEEVASQAAKHAAIAHHYHVADFKLRRMGFPGAQDNAEKQREKYNQKERDFHKHTTDHLDMDAHPQSTPNIPPKNYMSLKDHVDEMREMHKQNADSLGRLGSMAFSAGEGELCHLCNSHIGKESKMVEKYARMSKELDRAGSDQAAVNRVDSQLG